MIVVTRLNSVQKQGAAGIVISVLRTEWEIDMGISEWDSLVKEIEDMFFLGYEEEELVKEFVTTGRITYLRMLELIEGFREGN